MTAPTTHEQQTNRARLKVGIFSLAGLVLIGLTSVLVNDRPFWWRSCQAVKINVEDATGLKTKSPIRSLGLQVGYLRSVELSETYVTLGICLTAPVEVLPVTRAYIRGEGFLGDKFVELKPLKYVGGVNGKGGSGLSVPLESDPKSNSPREGSSANDTDEGYPVSALFLRALTAWIPSAHADDPAPVADKPPTSERVRTNKDGEREIPVGKSGQDMQQLIGRVDDLMKEMTGLTSNLKEALNPDDMKRVMKQLNVTLENAAKTFSPQGGLTHTAQRALVKLESSFEQLNEIMTKINSGKGSMGKLLNDESYAEEIRKSLINLNKLLGRTADIRFVVDVGAQKIRPYEGGRGYFRLQVWPNPTRYYLVGVSLDPRGRRSVVTTTTISGGVESQTQTTSVEETGLLLTGMLGKVFWDRLEGAVGALNGDGTLSIAFRVGPNSEPDSVRIQNDIYVRGGESGLNYRGYLQFRPGNLLFEGGLGGFYMNAGVESLRKIDGKLPLFFGGGISFDDEDIKLLFAFK